MLHEDGAGRDDARAYLQRWGLLPEDLARHVVRFITEPSSRTYVIAYPAGLELCQAYAAAAPDNVRRLLTEQVRIGDLIGARPA